MAENVIYPIKKKLSDFFMGKLYPVVVALLVTVGHITETEFYFNILHVLLAALAFCCCESIRPMLIVIPTFIFQVTKKNSPAVPNFSDYYFTEWRLAVVIILGVIVLASIVYFIIRNKIYKKINFKDSKLLFPLLLFSAALLLNGFNAETWSAGGLGFGATQVIIFLFVYLLFYHGFSKRDTERELIDYFTYITLIIAFMIIVQIAHMFLFGDVINEGEIIKDRINLGWCTCNPLGVILVSLIPMLFYGSMKKRHGWLYFLTAILVWVCAVSTCSRNALIFGTLTFAICLIIACIKGGKRRIWFICSFFFGIILLLLVLLIFRERIEQFFHSFFSQGMDNNGRFMLWGISWKMFVENPVFGNGFFALDVDAVYVPIECVPIMAHNTFLEILSSMGLFGFLAYVYYRVKTAKPFIYKPTLAKTMLGLSILVVLIESLLDIFVFGSYTMFYPLAALAVAFRLYDLQQKKAERANKPAISDKA